MHDLDRSPPKYRYSRRNFTSMLFLMEGFTISDLGRRYRMPSLLSYVGAWQHICIPGLQQWTEQVYDTKTYVFLRDVTHLMIFYLMRHIFRPCISVHFRNLFVSHIALPVKSDIKKPCRQHIQVMCQWKHESIRWKCLLLLIGRFRFVHITLRWFPKMYFRFPCHRVDISGPDVT